MAKIKERERREEDTDISIRLRAEDHDWLKDNRGRMSIRDKAHEVIEFYRKHHGGKT